MKHSIEINRSAEDVFAYLDQLDRHHEWQNTLVSSKVETEGPPRVGTRVTDRRQVGGGARDIPYEITEHDPPRRAAFRGTAGPVRPVGSFTIEPLDANRSRVTLDLDLRGHGIGKLVVPFARRQSAKEIPEDHKRLKEILESGGGATAGPETPSSGAAPPSA
jgi:uncharacterized membrane protein